jgi:hypothetical protein
MGKGVQDRLLDLYCETAGVSKLEGIEFWKERGRLQLYLQELWG